MTASSDLPLLGSTRAKGWRRVSHGLYLPESCTDRSSELAAWQLVVPPDGAFTHLTAAQLRGWWTPPLPADLPVVVSTGYGSIRPKRVGIRSIRHRVGPPAEELDGLRVTSVAETLLACAADLGLLDLVVLVDAALHAGSCTVDDLTVTASARRRGAPRLREALRWADGRAESAWEVLLRMLHLVCEVDVVPQHEVRHDGVLLGRGDLWIRGTRTLQEYDGGDHLEARRHRDDLRRDRRLAERGWHRHGYISADVLGRAVSILRDADRALGREHRPERIRPWHDLLTASLFTPAGTARMRARWGLAVPEELA